MLPQVVIVGRPNVGKSSLLNALAGRLVSIVDPTAGVTRDRISTIAEVGQTVRGDNERFIEITDTGGFGIKDSQGLTDDVERQIQLGIDKADLILFVVDAQEGITPLDRTVADLLRKKLGGDAKKKVLLVANKVDGTSHESGAHVLARLGFGDPVMVSAMSGHNKNQLREAIINAIDWESLGEDTRPPEQGMLLAIIGKRNAGKSTLVNALAGEERVIVSEVEGTTRDSVDVRFELDGRTFTAIDTAGVRKGKSIAGDIEFYSHHRSLRSIRRADVCLLLIDATVPVSQVDKQLTNELQEHFKPTVIVINKWDLAEQKATQEEYAEYLEKTLQGLNYAPIAFISAAKGEGVRELITAALSLYDQAGTRVPTSQLNDVMEQLLAQKTPTSGIGRRPKVYYCTQVAVHPPTIMLSVNDPSMFDAAYQRFLLNRFREMLPFAEVPIKIVVRGRTRNAEEGEESKGSRKPRGGGRGTSRDKSSRGRSQRGGRRPGGRD